MNGYKMTATKLAKATGITGLRFDRVALRVVSRVQVAVEPRIPKNTVVLLTLTAPIRKPAVTAAQLEAVVLKRLQGKPSPRTLTQLVETNTVRVKWVTMKGAKGFYALVHNPDVDAAGLLREMEEWVGKMAQV